MTDEANFFKNDLLKITKPARYIGKEWNILIKNPFETTCSIVLGFPDIYEIGMSHLGLKILYQILNNLPGVRAERAFVPWPDLGKLMKEKNIPLFSLENKIPVRSFDMVGLSLQTEMNYTNILYFLELSQIPFRSSERGDDFPIIIGGGSSTCNPEPISDFFDAFLIGEGEEAIVEIIQIVSAMKGQKKEDILSELAGIVGVYIPSFYQVDYAKDGVVSNLQTKNKRTVPQVQRRWLQDLDRAPYPEKIIVPYISIVHDRIPLEISRGCTRGCRFCQAGMIYRPQRERSPENIVQLSEKLVAATGYEEISLLSLSSTDHSQIEKIIAHLSQKFEAKNVSISLPSIRMDTFSVQIAQNLKRVRKSGLTFAPEAGTDRLRRIINKGLTDQEILSTLEKTFEGGWDDVKLYFMFGLPDEKESDLVGISQLVNEGLQIGKKIRGKSVSIHLNLSAFVPKPHTPFQWMGQNNLEEFEEKIHKIKAGFSKNRRLIRMNWSDFKESTLEAALARGDRRVSRVIEKAYYLGQIMDGWREFFSFERWLKAFEDAGIDYHFYSERWRNPNEMLPWDHISSGVKKEFLLKEWEKSLRQEVTPRCIQFQHCEGCGVC
ncbi:MAG: TIGR03960 family B12-binding radical SAM protein [Candidatus Atribacteria bacterium]|nr:TIGR03960 family B12-binding radical SAM protein [Candidatus Atribacteria bacterium]